MKESIPMANGHGLGNHPLVVIIGVIAALITVWSFVTEKPPYISEFGNFLEKVIKSRPSENQETEQEANRAHKQAEQENWQRQQMEARRSAEQQLEIEEQRRVEERVKAQRKAQQEAEAQRRSHRETLERFARQEAEAQREVQERIEAQRRADENRAPQRGFYQNLWQNSRWEPQQLTHEASILAGTAARAQSQADEAQANCNEANDRIDRLYAKRSISANELGSIKSKVHNTITTAKEAASGAETASQRADELSLTDVQAAAAEAQRSSDAAVACGQETIDKIDRLWVNSGRAPGHN